jgi:ketosteroid isomerase-like protein
LDEKQHCMEMSLGGETAEMPTRNVEIVRAGFDAFSRGDLAGMLETIDPAIEWTVREDLPDAGTYRGHEELITLLGHFEEVLDDQWFEPEDFIEGPGETVVVPLRWGGRGKSSGMDVASRQEAWVFTIGNGKVIRVTEYGQKQEALEALGLSE